MWNFKSAAFLLVFVACLGGGFGQDPIMTAADLQHLPSPPADRRIAYGEDRLQFGDLRLPDGPGPHPVAILVHGGCWLAQYDLEHLSSLAAALTREGIATWSLEYRRVGNPGGGWPGTFEDVAMGADYVRRLAKDYPLDLGRVAAVGHSAGGHLALWLAARQRLPNTSPIRFGDPLRLRGVLALAPAADLALLWKTRACGHVVDKLMGGGPEQHPERYRDGSPAQTPPLAVPQIVIDGAHDKSWSPAARSYFESAREAAAEVRLVTAPQSGHFEMIVPTTSTWPLVRDSLKSLLGVGDGPRETRHD